MKQQQTNKHSNLHREDQHITVEELWKGWKTSEGKTTTAPVTQHTQSTKAQCAESGEGDYFIFCSSLTKCLSRVPQGKPSSPPWVTSPKSLKNSSGLKKAQRWRRDWTMTSTSGCVYLEWRMGSKSLRKKDARSCLPTYLVKEPICNSEWLLIVIYWYHFND